MTFAYCLSEAVNLPCARVIIYRQAAFDVAVMLKERLSPREWERFTCAQPEDIVTSLIEIIEKSKRQT